LSDIAVSAGAPGHHAPAGLLDRLFHFIAYRAGLVLVLTGVITALCLALLVDWHHLAVRVTVDPSMDPLVAPDDPDRLAYDKLRQRFGNDETVLVILHSPDAYAPDMLKRVARLTRALRELPGVDNASSLTSTALPREEDGKLVLDRVHPAELGDPNLPERLRKSVAETPLAQNQLVSADSHSLAIAVSIDMQHEAENAAAGMYQQITAIADAEKAPGVDVWVTGAPVVRAAIRSTVMDQLRWVVPGIMLMLTVFLAVAFRSWRGILIPLGTIVLGLIWTFAFLVAIDWPLNLITSLVPPLLATMGLAYCAHVLSEFEALDPDADPRARAAHLLHDVAGPVVLTGATTAIGLLAMAITNLPAIREFAYFSSVGVVVTGILALTFVPACLAVAGSKPRGASLPGYKLFDSGARWLGRFDIERRRMILIVAGGVLGFAVFASFQIQVGDQFVGVFEPSSRVRSDYENINTAMGGVNAVSIELDGARADFFTDPENLKRVDELQRWIRHQPEVGSVTSLTDHLRILQKLLAKGDGKTLPATAMETSQLLFFGDSGDLRGYVNGDRSATLIRLRLLVDDTSDVSAFLDRLQDQINQLPRAITAQVGGNTVLLTRSLSSVISGQLQSIALALALIYVCLALQFASLKNGLLASLPTLLQTALYFGALGVTGVKLNATTSLVECLVLGLAVDDTIHYLARFNTTARRSASETEGAVIALSGVLRPITLTKAILSLGFLMLVTGELRNQVLFGWLAAATLTTAWFVDVFVTPAFMSGVRVVTIWDSLLLNLGQDPQHTIPLFRGLSNREARVFALMSDLHTVPANTRLMSEGDSAGDVYAVIDGELAVWVERDGQRIDIARLARGAVLGEAGYFGQKRTANVDTLTPVRLLRFDDADQERVLKQYPRVAARVFLNLNKVQAERRAAQIRQVG
jgi:predicted RND superfamily exporter protein